MTDEEKTSQVPKTASRCPFADNPAALAHTELVALGQIAFLFADKKHDPTYRHHPTFFRYDRCLAYPDQYPSLHPTVHVGELAKVAASAHAILRGTGGKLGEALNKEALPKEVRGAVKELNALMEEYQIFIKGRLASPDLGKIPGKDSIDINASIRSNGHVMSTEERRQWQAKCKPVIERLKQSFNSMDKVPLKIDGRTITISNKVNGQCSTALTLFCLGFIGHHQQDSYLVPNPVEDFMFAVGKTTTDTVKIMDELFAIPPIKAKIEKHLSHALPGFYATLRAHADKIEEAIPRFACNTDKDEQALDTLSMLLKRVISIHAHAIKRGDVDILNSR